MEIKTSSLIILLNNHSTEKFLDACFVPQHGAKYQESRDKWHIPCSCIAGMVVKGHKEDYTC